MRIIFLNLYYCKLESVLSEFVSTYISNTDVFCFQESKTDTELYKTLCQTHNPFYDWKYVTDKNNYNQTIFVKKGIPVLDSKTIFKENDDFGLALSLLIQVNGKSVEIINVHGLPYPGDKKDNEYRLTQSRQILESRSLNVYSSVIGGDFNLDVETQSIRFFEQNGYDNLVKNYGIQTTRNSIAWNNYPESKQYYADYVFVSEGTVVSDFQVPDVTVSDHLPMIVDINV